MHGYTCTESKERGILSVGRDMACSSGRTRLKLGISQWRKSTLTRKCDFRDLCSLYEVHPSEPCFADESVGSVICANRIYNVWTIIHYQTLRKHRHPSTAFQASYERTIPHTKIQAELLCSHVSVTLQDTLRALESRVSKSPKRYSIVPNGRPTGLCTNLVSPSTISCEYRLPTWKTCTVVP